MRASFPTQFLGRLIGKSREAGSFKTPDGEVAFGDAYDIAFEDSNGLVQTARVSVKALAEAADFDVTKTPAYTEVQVVGDVQVRDDGGYFRPSSVRLAKAQRA